MTRSFLSFNLALATAALIFSGAGATPASAQPASETAAAPAPEVKPNGDFDLSSAAKKYPEVQKAVELLTPTRDASSVPTSQRVLQLLHSAGPWDDTSFCSLFFSVVRPVHPGAGSHVRGIGAA